MSKRPEIIARITECLILDGQEAEAISIIAKQIRLGRSIKYFPISPISKYIVTSSSYDQDLVKLEEKCLILNYYNKNIQPDYVDTVSNLVENILERTIRHALIVNDV